MAVLPLLIIFLLQSNPTTGDRSDILSSNDPKRTSNCNIKHCKFDCLPTKCGNEEITLYDAKGKIKPDVTLQCMEEYSCLGHISIHARMGISFNRPLRGGTSKVYCNNARQRSCEGSQFKFVDVDHQYIIGSVSKSDILFKNAESAHIVLTQDMEAKPEQFFMNEVWTVNVKEFELIAKADYSAVGNVFDLSGVIKKSRIICKGYGACSGSLFIFSRCKMNHHEGNEIYCYNGACNDISVWVLHELTEGDYCPPESEVYTDQQIVKIVAATHTKEKVEEWKVQNIFIVTDVVKEDSAFRNLGLYLPQKQLMDPLDVVKVQGFQHVGKKKKKLLKNHAFIVRTFPNKEDWVMGLALLMKEVFCKYKDKYISSIDHSWVRTKFGAEAYGMQMVKSMTASMILTSMKGVITTIGDMVISGSSFMATITSCSTALIPLAIIWGGARIVHKIGESKYARHSMLPKSKLPMDEAENNYNEVEEEYMQRIQEECDQLFTHQYSSKNNFAADYNDFVDEYYYDDMVYGDDVANVDNVDNEYHYKWMESASMDDVANVDNVDNVQSVIGSDSDIFEYNPAMTAQYMIICIVFAICLFISILIAIICGAICGFFLTIRMTKNKYLNRDDKTFTEIDV